MRTLEPGAPLEAISTPAATAPHGHYAQAMRCGPLVFVSGFLGNVTTAETAEPGEQARRCLREIEAVLLSAGGDRTRIVRLGVFVSDLQLWPEINAACSEFFGAHRPARTIAPCGPLRLGSVVEMDAIAAL